jgi:hypothetical protein
MEYFQPKSTQTLLNTMEMRKKGEKAVEKLRECIESHL